MIKFITFPLFIHLEQIPFLLSKNQRSRNLSIEPYLIWSTSGNLSGSIFSESDRPDIGVGGWSEGLIRLGLMHNLFINEISSENHE